MDMSGMPEPFDRKEAGIPAAFIALLTSTLAITLGKCLPSLACRSIVHGPLSMVPGCAKR